MNESNTIDFFSNIITRPAISADYNRIRSDWRRSFEYSALARALSYPSPSLYRNFQSDVIDRLLLTCSVHVIAHAEDTDAIIAWAATSPPHTLHYVFVKEPYRGHGLARQLASHLERPVVFTHLVFSTQLPRLPKHWTYDPRPAILRG